LFETDATDTFEDMQPANEKTKKSLASHEASSSHLDKAVSTQSKGGPKGFDPWHYYYRGQNHATEKQKRKPASAEFIHFLITQNESLSERLEKIESALALMQSQAGLHEKCKASVTEDQNTQNQHESVATDHSEAEKTETVLQRERLRLARDVCIIACLVVGAIVLLKLSGLLDAVMGLVDQRTKSLRFEQSADCNAGR
jgi:hypothetical protein